MPPYWLQHEPGPQIQATVSTRLALGASPCAPSGHRITGQCLACYPIQPSAGIRSQATFARYLYAQHPGERTPRRYLTIDPAEAPRRPTYYVGLGRRFPVDLLESRAHADGHRSLGAPAAKTSHNQPASWLEAVKQQGQPTRAPCRSNGTYLYLYALYLLDIIIACSPQAVNSAWRSRRLSLLWLLAVA